MLSRSLFTGKYCCTFFLDSRTVHLTAEEIAYYSNLSDSLNKTNMSLTICFTFISEMERVHPLFQRLILHMLKTSSLLKIILSYEEDGKFGTNEREFLESIFELVSSGNTAVQNVQLMEYNENPLEGSIPIFDSLETSIVGMVADSRSSLARLLLVGFLPNRKTLELKIAKSALHHECSLKSLEMFHAENDISNDEHEQSYLVNAAVETREKRRAAVLVCCVLRACEGAPHFMDVILQVAEFVGVLDHPKMPKSMTL